MIPFPPETHDDWISRAGSRQRLIELTRWFLSQPVESDVLERWADDAALVPQAVLDEDLVHLTPTLRQHINIYGKYRFDLESGGRQRGFRPLRQASEASA